MHLASRVMAVGADFLLLGPQRTMLTTSHPVIAVSGLRTGCGKSPISRWLAAYVRDRAWRVAVIRHPMPYGNVAMERVQRFASKADLNAAHCTIEEREEYEPHIACGNVIFAGVDYAAVLRAAETEADILVWDGGNNDFPFIRPDLHIGVACEPVRPRAAHTSKNPSIFSFTPPIACTRPCWLTDPVTAKSWRTGTSASAESSAYSSADEALSPSTPPYDCSNTRLA
jgi:predicted GTPase